MSRRLQFLCIFSSAFSLLALPSCKATLQVFFASGHPTKLGDAAPSAHQTRTCSASCAQEQACGVPDSLPLCNASFYLTVCRYVQAIASKASGISQLHRRYEAEEHCQLCFLEPNTV